MISEWFRIRYESLVLVIKAVITMNRKIRIHPEHFYIEEPGEIIDRRFIEIPEKFRHEITEVVPFRDLDSS